MSESKSEPTLSERLLAIAQEEIKEEDVPPVWVCFWKRREEKDE